MLAEELRCQGGVRVGLETVLSELGHFTGHSGSSMLSVVLEELMWEGRLRRVMGAAVVCSFATMKSHLLLFIGSLFRGAQVCLVSW